MSSPRFFRLGLKTNPFFHTTLAERPDPGPGSHQARRLLGAPWRGLMLMGDKGMGKTHTMEWMLARWRAQGVRVAMVHLATVTALATPAEAVEVFALDEAQRARTADLGRLARWTLARPGRRLLLSSHQDVRPHLAPLDVESEEVAPCARDELDAYLEARIREATIPGATARLRFSEEARAALLEAAAAGFLALVDRLYAVCEALPEDGAVCATQVRDAAGPRPG